MITSSRIRCLRTRRARTCSTSSINCGPALRGDGALAFTFIDPHYVSWPGRYAGNNLRWRLEREIFLEKEKGNTLDIDVEKLSERARGAPWFVLVNGETYISKLRLPLPMSPTNSGLIIRFIPLNT